MPAKNTESSTGASLSSSRYAGCVLLVNRRDGSRPPRRSAFRYRSLPLWLQWALPFTAAAALVVALVVYVHHQTYDLPQVPNPTKPSAIAALNQEGSIVVRQQQAPHTYRMASREPPARGVRAAVVGYMRRQIAQGAMTGPITHASCGAKGGGGNRLVFRCEVTASRQVLTYPFDGVVDPATGVVTYCQRVQPPIPSMNIPVSRRCT